MAAAILEGLALPSPFQASPSFAHQGVGPLDGPSASPLPFSFPFPWTMAAPAQPRGEHPSGHVPSCATEPLGRLGVDEVLEALRLEEEKGAGARAGAGAGDQRGVGVGEGVGRRLSLPHGASADAVAQYMVSLCEALKQRNVLGERSTWTPATSDVQQCYRFLGELGRGHVGVVRLCEDRRTRQAFACKTVNKSAIKKSEDVAELRAEVLSLLQLQQRWGSADHIVALHEVLEDKESVHIVLEYCKGGDLFELVSTSKNLSERDAAHILRQLVLAVQQIHACGLVHRDIKLENVLLTSPKSQKRARVKIADFGLCAEVRSSSKIHGAAGSPFYMAPEVVSRDRYGREVDIWSLGVVLYACLAGYLPFGGRTQDVIFSAVLRANPSFSKRPWGGVSYEAKSLVQAMLCPDPQRRIGLQAILNHPWMLRHCPPDPKKLPQAQAQAQAQVPSLRTHLSLWSDWRRRVSGTAAPRQPESAPGTLGSLTPAPAVASHEAQDVSPSESQEASGSPSGSQRSPGTPGSEEFQGSSASETETSAGSQSQEGYLGSCSLSPPPQSLPSSSSAPSGLPSAQARTVSSPIDIPRPLSPRRQSLC